MENFHLVVMCRLLGPIPKTGIIYQKVLKVVDTYVAFRRTIKMRGLHPTKRMEAFCLFAQKTTGRPSANGLAAH